MSPKSLRALEMLRGTDVDYPTVALFECLVRLPEAPSSLAVAGLTQMLICKTLSEGTHPFIAELLRANVIEPLIASRESPSKCSSPEASLPLLLSHTGVPTLPPFHETALDAVWPETL